MRRFYLAFYLIVCVHLLYGQKSQSGLASYYHDSLEGNKTASGEIFHQNGFTAAHKTLPFGTWVKLTGPKKNQVVVKINDRLPAKSTRMIDLTTTAARQMVMINQGLKKVNLEVISDSEAWKWFIQEGFWNPFYKVDY